MDYTPLRIKMVEEQLLGRGIKNQKLLDIFRKIERHRFIPEELRSSAYGDFPLPIGENQTISQPYIVALMTECLDLRAGERVLEIGTGSGYQTAILAELAGEVYSIERHKNLAIQAESILHELGYNNVKIKVGDGSLGWPEVGPFERIIITAASPCIPEPLIRQLSENGKMVLPLGESFSQMLTLVEKKKDQLERREVCGCAFVPLVGEYGWRQEHA